jgi:hypothetical protein
MFSFEFDYEFGRTGLTDSGMRGESKYRNGGDDQLRAVPFFTPLRDAVKCPTAARGWKAPLTGSLERLPYELLSESAGNIAWNPNSSW